jgi:hypothetical protein
MRNSGAMSNSETAPASAPASAPLAAIVTPVLAFGATFVARKALAGAYHSVTGKDAPSNTDRQASLVSVMAWAAISGATVAVIEALIFRNTAKFFDE